MRKYFLFFFILPLFGAITNLRVIDATSTDVHIGYTAPNTSVCSFKLSQSATLTPLVPDTDPALFANSNLDSRVGSLGTGSTTREIVIGKQNVVEQVAVAGNFFGAKISRALITDRTHYFELTCGSDVATLTISVPTIPIGNTRADSQQVTSFTQYDFPDNNPLQFPSISDPQTGTETIWSAAALGWTYGNAITTPFTVGYGTNWSATTGSKTQASQLIDTNYITNTTAATDWFRVQIGYTGNSDATISTLTYTLLVTDVAKILKFNNGAGTVVTLPQPGASFSSTWCADYVSNAATVVLTPTSSTINGAATYNLTVGNVTKVCSDGSNWFTQEYQSGRFPSNSSFPTVLSSQSVQITGSCAAGGANCTGSNSLLDVVVTRDGQIMYPIRTLTLPAVEATLSVCGDNLDPCSHPDVAGDIFTFEAIPDQVSFSASPYYKVSDGLIYTAGSCTTGNTNWCFEKTADCLRLWPGEQVVFNDIAYGDGQVTIYSINCAASPPTMVTSGGYDLTTPIPFGYLNGLNNNPRFGVMIRKHNAVANTFSINAIKWRIVSSLAPGFDNGSGGFGKISTILKDSNDFYHIATGLIGQVIGWNPTTKEIRYLGTPYYNPINIDIHLQNQQAFNRCKGPNDFLWSDRDANDFYCVFASMYPQPALPGGIVNTVGNGVTWVSGAKFIAGNDIWINGTSYAVAEGGYIDDQHLVLVGGGAGTQTNVAFQTVDHRVVLVKMTYTGNDVAQTADLAHPDSYPVFAATGVIVTPCNSPCTSVSDDFTPYAQTRRYSSKYVDDSADFNHPDVTAIQNDVAIWRVLNGSQDSFGWNFTIDLTISPGSQQIFSGFDVFRGRYSRFCADHTPQSPQGPNNDFFVIETGAKCQLGATNTSTISTCDRAHNGCAACPNMMLDGKTYTSSNFWCGTINLTSAWDMSWGPQPSGYAVGDPVNPTLRTDVCNLRWVDTWRVGDFLTWGNGVETDKILQITSPGVFVTERGIGATDHNTAALAIGGTILTSCNCMNPNPDLIPSSFNIALSWFYLVDPDGTASYPDYFQNHGFHQSNHGITPGYAGRNMDFSMQTSVQDLNGMGWVLRSANAFGGQSTNCAGNGCDEHPTANNLTAPLFNNALWYADVNVLLYEQASNNNATPSWSHVTGDIYLWTGTNNLPYRTLDIQGIRGFDPLVNISSPTSDITAAVDGTFCIAIANSQCYSGSTAGQLYFKIHALGNQVTCKQAEFYGLMMADACFWGVVGSSGSTVQYRIPTSNANVSTGISFRGVGKSFRRPREAATANVKSTVDGLLLFERTNFYRVTPFWTEDGIDRSSFLGTLINLPSPPAMTSTAKIHYGYNPAMRCTSNFDDVCDALSSTINLSSPTFWTSEHQAGVSCSTGCNIMLPLVSNKRVYYRAEYYDSMGMSLGQEAIKIISSDGGQPAPPGSGGFIFSGKLSGNLRY